VVHLSHHSNVRFFQFLCLMRLRGKGIFVLGRVFFLLDLMLFLNSADISLWLQSGYKPLNGGCNIQGRCCPRLAVGFNGTFLCHVEIMAQYGQNLEFGKSVFGWYRRLHRRRAIQGAEDLPPGLWLPRPWFLRVVLPVEAARLFGNHPMAAPKGAK